MKKRQHENQIKRELQETKLKYEEIKRKKHECVCKVDKTKGRKMLKQQTRGHEMKENTVMKKKMIKKSEKDYFRKCRVQDKQITLRRTRPKSVMK